MFRCLLSTYDILIGPDRLCVSKLRAVCHFICEMFDVWLQILCNRETATVIETAGLTDRRAISEFPLIESADEFHQLNRTANVRHETGGLIGSSLWMVTG